MARILIVDDDADFLMTASRWLVEQGHECHLASSAYEAIVVAEANPPECFILDIRLTEIRSAIEGDEEVDGVALFEELKKKFPRCRAIFMSAYTDYEQSFLQRRGASRLLDKGEFTREIGSALRESLLPHVLFVEDDYDFVETASLRLRELGIRCIPVTGWNDLRRVIAECDFGHFDAIIVDGVLDQAMDLHGWHVVQQASTVCPVDSLFILTGKEQGLFEELLGAEYCGRATKQGLLAAASRLREDHVLDKNGEWASQFAAMCMRRR